MLLSRRADHCALISEMRSSLRDQASAWIWERELARGRAASSLIAATACGLVLSVPALSLLLAPRVVAPFLYLGATLAPAIELPVATGAALRSLGRRGALGQKRLSNSSSLA